MPILLELEFEDGSKKMIRIPAEIWRYDSEQVSKLVITEKPLKSVVVDPRLETADIDTSNNYFPPRMVKSRFQLFKSQRDQKNEMQKTKAGKISKANNESKPTKENKDKP